jgi:chromosomal replication initiator protein
MIQDTFNYYADVIASEMNIETKEIFTRFKRRHLVDSRQVLFYLCSKSQMNVSYIQKFMEESGLPMKHSTIIHGINRIDELMSTNKPMQDFVKSVTSKIGENV